MAGPLRSQVATSTPFDNSTNGFSADNVQDAIEEVSGNIKTTQFLQYQYIGTMNFDQYLYSNSHANGFSRRSGDPSNGYRYSASAPLACGVDGSAVEAVVIAQGLAVSTGSAASTVTLNLELWSVGFTNEGTKLGDIPVTIDSSSFTIGSFWNSSVDSNFSATVSLDIDVSKENLLGVKFNRVTGSSDIVSADNVTVLLKVQS